MQPYGMSDEEMEAAGISLGTAQPGQEQRMECECPERMTDMVNYGIHACRDGKRIAPKDLYLTRPTADLGEDGELLRKLERLLDLTGHAPIGGQGHAESNADAKAIRDRLILYREALGDFVAAHAAWLETDVDTNAASHACAAMMRASDKARAVLSRWGIGATSARPRAASDTTPAS